MLTAQSQERSMGDYRRHSRSRSLGSRPVRRLQRLLGALATLALSLLAAPAALAWTAPPAQYGVHEVVNVPFTASDGTRLMTSVYYPADLTSGHRAPGRFPVLVD